MIKVGLTGGIGSGKSLVARLFASLGIPVFYADHEARTLMHTHQGIVNQLQALFGSAIYSGGQLNKSLLAEIIFSNPAAREQVNQIVHPVVFDHFNNWIIQHSDYPYVIKEAAILFETGANAALDKVIVVSAPEALRYVRIVRRDGLTASRIRERMQAQWPDERKLALADFILINDEVQLVMPQVLNIHRQLLSARL